MPKLNSASSASISRHFRSVRVAAGVASTLLAVLLSGCELTSTANPTDTSNVAFGGKVHGGNQPVTSSNIALFATAANGYGGTLTPLATTTTDGNGDFHFTTSYTCPAGSQAYIVAAGGNPGLAPGTDNSALMMMAALGPCANLNSGTNIWLNEVTTVAAAYALSGFAPANNSLTEAAVVAGTNVPGFTTTSTNTQGLLDAVANAMNIVDFKQGKAYSTTPTTAANGVVPTATINALADIIQDCVNSTGPSSASCTSLFAAATPPTGTGISAPVNVLQAALDIAQYPANNPAGLFALISAQAAFPTSMSASPNDWTIGITYTNSLLASGVGLGVNNLDQVFVSGTGYLIDFTPQGAPLSSANLVTGSAITSNDSLREIVFDNTGTATTSGNLFVSDGAATGVWQFNPNSNAVAFLNYDVAPVSEANANTYGIAVDGLGDVWTSSYSKATCASVTCPLVEFASGTAYSPFSTFSTFNVNQPTGALGGSRGTAFDVKTGNIWITAIDDNLGELFNVTPSSTGVATATSGPSTISGFGQEAGAPSKNTAYGTISVAVDSTSRAWFLVAGGATVTGTNGTPAVTPAIYPVSSSGTLGSSITGGGLSTPNMVAVDGNNNLFIANTGASTSGGPGDLTNAGTVVEYSPGYNSNAGGFLSGSLGLSPGAPSGSAISGSIYKPSYLAIDRSGAVWILSSGSGVSTVSNLQTTNLVQILGVAAPTNPVQAAGQYGVKP